MPYRTMYMVLSVGVFASLYSITTVLAAPIATPLEFVHHSNQEMYRFMDNIAQFYPDIARVYTIGDGGLLKVIEISDNVGQHEPGEPEFKYIANMHGNEVTGRETLLHLINELCVNYGRDEDITNLVNNTRIHIMPSMNPYGYNQAYVGSRLDGRTNKHGVDLNRNFPDRFSRTHPHREQETIAVINWVASYPFVLSANLHNGALVANYPYDNSASGQSKYTACPDDDIFKQLALAYSNAHATMHLGAACPTDASGFEDGITNGADWYSVDGGMQDYNYLNSNCFEITIEQGCVKFPEANKLERIWFDNKDALLAYIEEVHKGVKGFVKDTSGVGIANAIIEVTDRDHSVRSAEDGDYWRLLAPGTYTLNVSANGFHDGTVEVTVGTEEVTVVNITLVRIVENTVNDDNNNDDQETNPPSEATSSGASEDEPSGGSTVDTTTSTITTGGSSSEEEGPSNTTSGLSGSGMSTDSPDEDSSKSSSATMQNVVTNDSSRHKKKNPPVTAGVTMLVIIVLLVVAILTLSILIAYHARVGRNSRNGYRKVSVEDDAADTDSVISPFSNNNPTNSNENNNNTSTKRVRKYSLVAVPHSQEELASDGEEQIVYTRPPTQDAV